MDYCHRDYTGFPDSLKVFNFPENILYTLQMVCYQAVLVVPSIVACAGLPLSKQNFGTVWVRHRLGLAVFQQLAAAFCDHLILNKKRSLTKYWHLSET